MIAEWERICSLWEREMTVSIAAACHRGERDGGPKIILCTDWRESGLLGSSETAHKQPWLPANWRCLTAGETSEINVIVPMLRKAFHDAGTIDETNVGSIVSAEGGVLFVFSC